MNWTPGKELVNKNNLNGNNKQKGPPVTHLLWDNVLDGGQRGEGFPPPAPCSVYWDH